MILIRKIDWALQLFILVLGLCSIPFMQIFVLLWAQFIIGCMQLISGGLNALGKLPSFLRIAQRRYWLMVIAVLLLLSLTQLPKNSWSASSQIIVITGLIAAWVIAIYYLYWYRKIILHLEYEKELQGLIKS